MAILIWYFLVSGKEENNPPDVPEGLAAWTVRKDGFWVYLYHCAYTRYPRDICSYVRDSAIFVVWASIGFFCFLHLLLLAVKLLSFFVWHGVPALAVWMWDGLVSLPSTLVDFIGWLFTESGTAVMEAAGFAPIWWIAGVSLFILLAVLFFRSDTWKLWKLFYKAKKERFCPRIRVV